MLTGICQITFAAGKLHIIAANTGPRLHRTGHHLFVEQSTAFAWNYHHQELSYRIDLDTAATFSAYEYQSSSFYGQLVLMHP